MLPRVPALVAEVSDSTGAKKAGLKEKDQIIGINDKEIKYFDEIKPMVSQMEGDTVQLKVLRDQKEISLTTILGKNGAIGFFPNDSRNGRS